MVATRPLTENEIQEILDDLPMQPGICKSAVKFAHKSLKRKVKALLYKSKIDEDGANFEAFKERIINTLLSSFIAPGTAVGIKAATSIGAGVTQITLDSFKQAGSAENVTETFLRVKALSQGSLNDKNPRIDILFVEDGDQSNDFLKVRHLHDVDQIISKKYELEMTTLANVVKSWSYITMEEAREIVKDIPDSIHTSLVCLELDTYRMYTHRVMMTDIETAIVDADQELKCFWRSQRDGKLVVGLPVSVSVTQHTDIMSPMTSLYFYRAFLSIAENIVVKGVRGFRYMEPVAFTFFNAIRRMYKHNGKTTIELVNSEIRRGPSVVDLIDFLNREHGYEFEYPEFDFETQTITLPDDSIERSMFWGQVLALRVYAEDDMLKGWKRSVLWRSDVDLTRLTSTSPEDMKSLVGIAGTRVHRALLLQDLMRASGLSISSRHIAVLFDTITQLGDFTSSNTKGLRARNADVIAMAVSEKPMDVFSSACMFGTVDDVKGASSSVFTGSKSRVIGTGTSRVNDIGSVTKDYLPTVKFEFDVPSDLTAFIEELKVIVEDRYGVITERDSEVVLPDIMSLALENVRILRSEEKKEREVYIPDVDLQGILDLI